MSTIALSRSRNADMTLVSRNLATVSLLTISVCAVIRELSRTPWPSPVAGAALLLFVVLQWPRISLTYRIFAILAPTLATGLWFAGMIDGVAVAAGLDRAACFTFFLTSLAVLRESARSSPLVRRCGKVLVNQPP